MIHKTQAPPVAAVSSTVCSHSREGANFVILIAGELDFAAVESAPLMTALSSYRSNEPLDVVLDLEAVTFMDSTGLGWLMAVRAAAELATRRIRLRGSSSAVDQVLEMTQLKRYFPEESRPL
jgi:anti-sigma B factor antagonist